MSNAYDSANTKDNENRKFQEDSLGDVAVNVIDKDSHDKLDAIVTALGAPPSNLRSQILAAADREQEITWADFGTKTQRVTQIDYTSATYSGVIARKSFAYTLVGNNYRLDTIIWEII